MRKLITALLAIILGLAFAVNAYADPPHGKKHKDKPDKVKIVKVPATAIVIPTGVPIVTVPDKRPPGWDRGKKTGWGTSNVPPGLAKKGVITTPIPVTDRFFYNWFGVTPVKDNMKPAVIIKPKNED